MFSTLVHIDEEQSISTTKSGKDELGEDFLELLNAQSEKRIESFVKGEFSESNEFKLTRKLLNIFSYVCHIDLFQDEQYHDLSCKSRRELVKGEKIKPNKWQKIYHCLVFWLIIRLSISIYLDYNYDMHLFKYKSFKILGEKGIQSLGIKSNYSAIIEELERTLIEKRAISKMFGAPYINSIFFNECIHMLMIIGATAVYVQLMFYFKYVSTFNVSLVRALIDYKREQMNYNKMVVNEMNKIIRSSRTFMEKLTTLDSRIGRFVAANYDNHKPTFVLPQQTVNATISYGDELINSNVRRMNIFGMSENCFEFHRQKNNGTRISNHLETINQLKQFALSAAIEPKNRFPNWLKLISRIYNVICIGFALFNSIMVAVMMFVMPRLLRHENLEINIETFQDAFMLFELWLLSMIVILPFGSYISLFVCYFIDQICSILEVKRTIKQFIELNDNLYLKQLFSLDIDIAPYSSYESYSFNTHNHVHHHDNSNNNNRKHLRDVFCHHQQKTITEKNNLSQATNGQLLYVILKYRLFVRATKPARHLFSYIVSCTLEVFVLFPVIAILHTPILPAKTSHMLMATFLIFLFATDSSMSLICYIHARSIGLYSDLYNLLAYIVFQRESSKNHPSNRGINNLHTSYLLRKLLSNADIFVEQLSIVIFGNPFTYNHLLKTHFWTGIMALGVFFASKTDEISGANKVNIAAAKGDNILMNSIRLL